MNQARNRQELLSWINKVSFMAYDMALYLDTHPDDQQALEFFQKYSQMRRQALSNYASPVSYTQLRAHETRERISYCLGC